MKQKTTLATLSIVFVLLLTACSGSASLAVKPSTSLSAQIAQTNPTATVAAPTATSPAASASVSTSASALGLYQSSLESIYSKVNPSVVSIMVIDNGTGSGSGSQVNPNGNQGNQGNGNQYQYSQGFGSGFVWDTQGHIITNNHVVDGASTVQVTFYDGTTVSATVVGTDPDSDLAVIKVNVDPSMLHPVQVADSTQVKVGQLAVAIGNPFDLENTMTVGIVSGLGRSLPSNLNSTGTTYSIPDIIQTDAAINPGNSGGVLVNDQGQLIGVTSAIESPVQANVGIGLVIPSSLVSRVVPDLIKTGTYVHPYLGVTIAALTPDMATAMKLNATQRGAMVVDVTSGGPADKAGLKGSSSQITVLGQQIPVGGDVITAINGSPIKTQDDLIAYLAENTSVGQKVTLTILRGGTQQSIDVTLGTRPAGQPATQQTQPSGSSNPAVYMGVSVEPLSSAIDNAMSLPSGQTGLLIEQVESGSPADQAGLQGSYKPVQINGQRVLVGGDVITAIDGNSVSSLSDLQSYLSNAQVGQQVTLDILRNGQSIQVTVTLAARPGG
jgi:serine protease Do